jgi:hypothetical protein
MSRVLCSLLLASSVALLAFGPTAAFAAPGCKWDNCTSGNSKHVIESCTNSGCTEKNKPGNHCFQAPDHQC